MSAIQTICMKYIILAVCSIALFSGCVKDSCVNTFTLYQPVYKSLTAVRADMKSAAPETIVTTGKIYLYKNFIYLNEPGKGVHIIDNSNPSAPVNIAFLPIPGNLDIAIKDDYLYADAYSDLAVFNISDPENITAYKFLNNVFPNRNMYYYYASNNPDSVQVMVDLIPRDTVVNCDTYNGWIGYGCINCSSYDGTRLFTNAAAVTTGVGGSMAGFTIINDFLYTISYNNIYGFNINNAADPKMESTTNINDYAEAIYPFQSKLFIGTPSGMLMYDVSNPVSPAPLGQFSHIRSCDPVIADENNAYVTLRSGNACAGYTNQLDVLDITNLMAPLAVRTYEMTNPHGLSKDEQWLFICDGGDGLKIYDATNPADVQLIKKIEGMNTYDVITNNHIALVIAADGLYQFDYSNINDIQQLSKIAVQHN
ncbi:hypothetical protein BH10BAC2_BH10BAC2_10920 [soil metagenome]